MAQESANGGASLLISYTLFPDVWPKTKTDRSDVPWGELVSRIRNTPSFPDKAHCPLVSLCEYGTLLSGSAKQPILRHAANVVRAYGAELDYDGELISAERGASLFESAKVRAVIYTSPSHTPSKPRWRAILPFSEPTSPEKRAEYLARANRILGGIASRESFTLSQSFYIGRVQGADYQVFETEGRCIDLAADLEPQYYIGFRANGVHARDETTDEQLRLNISEGHDRHQSCLSLSSRLASRGMLADDIASTLRELLGPHSVNADGVDFSERAPGYAETAVRKYGESRRRSNVVHGDFSKRPAGVDANGEIKEPTPSQTPEQQRIDELARLDEISYDRVREAVAAELKIRVKTLDEVRGARQEILFPAKPKNVVRGPFVEASGFNDTDIANGVRLVERHGRDLRYTAATDWLVWDGTRWKIDEKSVQVQARAKNTALAIYEEIATAFNRDEVFKHAKYSEGRRGIEGMIYMARSEPGIPGDLAEFDSHPMLLNLANGTLDLKTGELHEHRRTDCITKITPIEYQQHAECPKWMAFMEFATGGEPLKDGDGKEIEADPNNPTPGRLLLKYLQRAAGYCLTGLVSEQVVIFLHGDGGRGKSLFSEVLRAILGEYAMVADRTLIMQKRHEKDIPSDIAALRGMRLALTNETEQGQRLDEAKLKELTGGDTLKGEFKYKSEFNFEPTHKLVIRGNYKPSISGQDEGIWRRLHLVPFDIPVPPDKKDAGLLEYIKQHELSGVLKWAVEGCLEWQRMKGLQPPEQVTKAVQEYRVESDSLGQFIEEFCIKDPNKWQQSSHFFKRYQAFCHMNAKKWVGTNDLPREMLKKGFDHGKKACGKVFLGLELIPPEETPPYGDER